MWENRINCTYVFFWFLFCAEDRTQYLLHSECMLHLWAIHQPFVFELYTVLMRAVYVQGATKRLWILQACHVDFDRMFEYLYDVKL